MEKKKQFVQQPFVGKMKDQKGSVFMQASTRALRRGNFNSHKTMVLQVIQQFKHVGGSINKDGMLAGGKLIVVSGKGVWHDTSAYAR